MKTILLITLVLIGTVSYGQYSSGVNLDLYERVLREKQMKYERNVEEIQREIEDAGEAIEDLREINESSANYYSTELQRYCEKLNRSKLDYADFSTYSIIKQNIRAYKVAANRAARQTIRTNTQPEYRQPDPTYSKSRSLTGDVEVYSCSPILELAQVGAKIKAQACSGRVKVIESKDDYFYRVYYYDVKSKSAVYGYMAKTFVK